MKANILVDIRDLSPVELCNFLDKEFFKKVSELFESVHQCVDNSLPQEDEEKRLELLSLLFGKLESETMQMMRYDEQIFFPLVKNYLPLHEVPGNAMEKIHVRILNVLEKIRQTLHNYLPEAGWSECVRDTSKDMFSIEQLLQQAIYIKEYFLLPRLKERMVL